MQQLTDDEQAILDFQRLLWTYPGLKEQAVREKFDLSLTTSYERINDHQHQRRARPRPAVHAPSPPVATGSSGAAVRTPRVASAASGSTCCGDYCLIQSPQSLVVKN